MSPRSASSLLTLCLALVPLLGAHASPSNQGSLPGVNTLVTRHLEAMGGEERLRSVRTCHVTSQKQDAQGQSTVSQYRARPNLVRYEFQKDGVQHVKAFDGKQAWLSENGAAKAMPAEKSQMMAEGAHFDDVLLDPAKRGVTLKLAGVEQVRGAPAYVLVLTRSGHKGEETRYLDQKTMLEVKRVVRGEHEGKPFVKTAWFSEQRPVDGIMVNHVTEWESDGEKGKSTVQRVRFDEELDPTLFKMPRGRS
jgi:hypothetical protein